MPPRLFGYRVSSLVVFNFLRDLVGLQKCFAHVVVSDRRDQSSASQEKACAAHDENNSAEVFDLLYSQCHQTIIYHTTRANFVELETGRFPTQQCYLASYQYVRASSRNPNGLRSALVIPAERPFGRVYFR